jgi:hypothetical protein
MMGGGKAGAAVAPTVAMDASQYLAGATVTYTGSGWTGCSSVQVDVFGPAGSTIATGLTPTASGTFTGTSTAGSTLTTYPVYPLALSM